MSTVDVTAALGAGSGIDIKQLAQNLADVERKPREDAIQARIDKSQGRISGYGAIMFGLKSFKEAFAALNDRSDFGGATVRNSAPGAFDVTASAGAELGRHTVEVQQLANAQVTRSGDFSSADVTLNNGNPFSLAVTRGGTTTTISVSRRSPEGVVEAINSKSATTGVEARLVNTGDPVAPVTIVLTGESGASNGFSVETPAGQAAVPGLTFDTQLQSATDARVVIDGITISRSDNTVDDVIKGVKLDLLSPSAAVGVVSVGRDTAPVKAKIENLVKAYNDLQDFLDTLGDPKSTDEEYGGVLENDSLLRYVRDQARSMVTALSSSPGQTVSAMRDIGVTLDRYGRLQIDDTKLDVSLLARFDEIAKVFTANTENLSLNGDAARGIAGDALKKLDTLMATGGPILSRSSSADSQLKDAQDDLAELKDKMDGVYERYLKQFAIMDSMVGQMNSLRTSLKGQFDNLAAMYSNK